jgi:glycosyltransferase involved in cell wall biosynthesis
MVWMAQVSVVVPLFNKAKYIEQTIATVLAQTVQNYELVVVNDGSTDGGDLIVAAVKDSRIKLIHQENAGAGAARNRGIIESSSDFIALLDADDEWEPNHLEVLLDLRAEYPEAGLFATACRIVTNNCKVIPCIYQDHKGPIDFFRPEGYSKIFGKQIHTSSCAFNRDIIEKIGYFNTIKNAQDVDFFGRIALDYEVIYTSDGFSVFRYDRSDLKMERVRRPLDDGYCNHAFFLSKKMLEAPSDSAEFFTVKAKFYIDKKKNLLDFLWGRQIHFIALFIFWGYRREAFSHFLRTLRYYEKLPRSIRINIALMFFLGLSILPSAMLRAVYGIKNRFFPSRWLKG